MHEVEPELQAATIAVLRERGWDGLTLERVAEVAGRARSTLWRQGLTRDVLIGALVGRARRRLPHLDVPDPHVRRHRAASGSSAASSRCATLLDRHLPLLLATDEAFHQAPAPGQPPDYLHPFITFLRDGVADGSLAPSDDVIETADVLFNAVAWPYVHLRGRHDWPADQAASRVVGLVLDGIAAKPRTRSRKERS